MDRTYICIDLKSYYASVECVHRGLDPLKANLLVADESRSDQTICLAVSPSLKAKGVPGRPRLFEAKQKIREYEAKTRTKVDYIIAVPRMAEYERISAQIYGIYLRYVAPEDIHVYSIDECFIDCTCYLHAYRKEANKLNTNPAHVMAMTMIRDVLRTTGITATVGIGTNLYLAKVAMDIVAKKQPADKDSLSNGQVLSRPYKYQEARLVFREMIEVLCTDMFSKNLVTQGCSWWVSYDYKSLEVCPSYDGPLSMDFYGRIHPKHSNGTVKLPTITNNIQIITAPLLKSFDDKTDHRLLYRRLGVCANDVKEDGGVFQLNMFIDYEALERDRKLQGAMLEVRRKFGANALFKGMNLMDGATTLERNQQIGGHKA